ncbi:DUF5723 family protein [uncultured Culturomica sp.]|jgi:cell division septation protein DedD|uniref:DUF5723 family protein n=1 Tax=uncultured Culturomica sp. TaxID=1926654 RepID=UPI00033B55CF|nr:DUF5723 family protein [uncultured Culturomica sp.]CCZ08138.1 sporulation domain-containing protein [Odoribacter sp. CAG:788]
MRIKMKRCVLVLLAVLSLAEVTKGQDGNNVTYYLSNLPQRVRINPSYQPEYKVWIGLPALSGISVNYMNSSFGIDDLIRKGKNDSLYVDIDRMYKSLRKNNIVSLFNENSLLTVGIRFKSWYATLDITQKNDVVFRTSKDIFTFLKNGNAPYLGKNFDLGGIGLKASLYDEFAFGLSKKLNNKWTVGGRAKFLLGIANVDMKKSKISVNTKSDGSSLLLHSEQDICISAPVTLDYKLKDGFVEWDDLDADVDDFNTSMVLNTKNPGFALDLGAEYQFNEKVKFYASIIDAGFIHWGGKGYRFTQNTTFDWTGADASNSGNSNDENYVSIDDAFDDMIDSLKNNFRLKEGNSGYTTMLHSKMYLGATYDVHKMLTVGGLLRMTMMDKTFYPSFTASADARLCRNVSAAVSYTVMPGNYVNLGVGITAKAGPVQFYASTDNVMGANYTSTQSLGGRFGINLLFGHKDKKKKVKEEEIPAETVVVPVKKPEPEVKKDTVQLDTTPKVEPRPEMLVAPEREETMLGVGETGKPYHVILGSFKSKLRAERLQGRLVKQGFKEAKIMQNEQGMYRVSAVAFSQREEAWAKVFEIREKYVQFFDAWALKVN